MKKKSNSASVSAAWEYHTNKIHWFQSVCIALSCSIKSGDYFCILFKIETPILCEKINKWYFCKLNLIFKFHSQLIILKITKKNILELLNSRLNGKKFIKFTCEI